MRIECTQCQKLFEADTAIVVDAEVRFLCTNCDAPQVVSLASEPVSPGTTTSVSEPAGTACPKCAAPVDMELDACASCGLATLLFAEYQADESKDDHELEDAWQRLNENWQAEEQHEDFMRHVASTGDFRGGAARYRVSQRDASRAARSSKMLNRIQTMAAAALLSTKPQLAREKEPFKGAVVLLIFMVTVAAAGGLYAFFKSNSAKPKDSGARSPVMLPKAAAPKSVAPVVPKAAAPKSVGPVVPKAPPEDSQ